jgi:hypothetical protein
MSLIDPEFDFPMDEMFPTPPEPIDRMQQLALAVRQVFSAYVTGDHYQTSAAILRVLQQLNDLPVLGFDQAERLAMGQAIESVLCIICQPDYQIPEEFGFPMLVFNALIGNIMEGCLHTTTDSHLLRLRGQTQEIFKSLLLYSARNTSELDISGLLVLNPDLVSRWLYQTWKVIFSGNCSPKVTANLSRFLSQMDHRIIPAQDMQELYFGCSYPGIPEERRAKELINQAIRKHISVTVTSRPNPRRVAVFSEYWFRGHSVHRTLAKYIEALRPDFHVTLLHSSRDVADLDSSMFDATQRIPFDGSSLDLSVITNHEFSALFFPDVGMTLPSILMVNQRIAPVQVMMTGHPVSTFGSQLDYFISGQKVDVPMLAHQNYSERLVLLPGYGAVHELPSYRLQGRKKTTNELIINCSWYGQKIHWRCLQTVNEALKQSSSRARLRIFSGNAPIMHKGYPAFLNEISRQMTNCWVDVVPHVPYQEYMGLMEEGDFAIDVFPYAGSNTVADNLHLRKPTLVREGYRWFNRIGPAMLRSVGLDEWIATSDGEYQQKLIRLVNDPEYVQESVLRLQQADLESLVYHSEGAPELVQFVKNVVSDNRFYPGDEPIIL